VKVKKTEAKTNGMRFIKKGWHRQRAKSKFMEGFPYGLRLEKGRISLALRGAAAPLSEAFARTKRGLLIGQP
jgi:hypothetical protein